MAEKVKKTLYLDKKAADFLLEMGNASDYVSGLVIRHEREWQGAWQDLVRGGWTRAEVDVAVRVLYERWLVNDLWWNNHKAVPGALAAVEDEALQAGIDPARWADIINASSEREVANHLLVLSREYALGNDRARSRVQTSVRVRWSRGAERSGVQVTIDGDVPGRAKVKGRLSAMTERSADFALDNGPYEREDGSLSVSLLLMAPTNDRADVLTLVKKALGVDDVAWQQ